MHRLKHVLRWVMAVFYVASGTGHFVNPGFYLKIMPRYLPLHRELVYLSGVFEILLGILVAIPATASVAAWGLIALLMAVFPANIQMLMDDLSNVALWVRLPLQGVLIAWAWWYTGDQLWSADR